MENYHHSVGQPQTDLHRPRVPSADEEIVDGPAAAKRSRTSEAVKSVRKQMVDDSLLSHMTHVAVPNDTNNQQIAEFFGTQASRNAFCLLPASNPRMPNYPSPYQEPDQILSAYRTGVASRLNTLTRDAAERQRYVDGITGCFVGGYPSSSPGFTGNNEQLLPGSFSANWSFSPSSVNFRPLQTPSGMQLSERSWLDQIQRAPMRAPFLQSEFHHSMLPPSFLTMPTTGFRFGEDVNQIGDLETGALETRELPLKELPAVIALPEDRLKLSVHQVFLRHQIEAFEASEEDVSTHTRGRNKRIQLGQVGIRCRHCANLPVAVKQKGSVYFPATLLGLYQAAQNMSATHLQCGLCTQTPYAIKHQFVALMSTRAFGSGAGRPYWAQAAKKLGLVDTDEGIRFARITSYGRENQEDES